MIQVILTGLNLAFAVWNFKKFLDEERYFNLLAGLFNLFVFLMLVCGQIM